MYTRRNSLQTATSEEIEELLVDADLPYVPNAALGGRGNSSILVDFLVDGMRRQSALLALGAQSAQSAHASANEVFRKQYELRAAERQEQRVTVFDDRFDVYRDDDLNRLRDVSEVLPLSSTRDIVGLLAAA